MITVEFDPAKEQHNIREHGLDFSLAESVLNSSFVVEIDDRYENGEYRYHAFAAIGDRVLLVVYSDPDENDDVVRVIGLRRATPTESRNYERERKRLYQR